MSFDILHKDMIVKGVYSRVHCAVYFNPKVAIDLLAPFAINSPTRVATECGGIVSVTILKVEEAPI